MEMVNLKRFMEDNQNLSVESAIELHESGGWKLCSIPSPITFGVDGISKYEAINIAEHDTSLILFKR